MLVVARGGDLPLRAGESPRTVAARGLRVRMGIRDRPLAVRRRRSHDAGQLHLEDGARPPARGRGRGSGRASRRATLRTMYSPRPVPGLSRSSSSPSRSKRRKIWRRNLRGMPRPLSAIRTTPGRPAPAAASPRPAARCRRILPRCRSGCGRRCPSPPATPAPCRAADRSAPSPPGTR